MGEYCGLRPGCSGSLPLVSSLSAVPKLEGLASKKMTAASKKGVIGPS